MKINFYAFFRWLQSAKYIALSVFFCVSILSPLFTWGQTTPATDCEAGLLATYYRGYFYDDLSFFARTKPGIVNRAVNELNFPFGQTDMFNVGDVAVYNSPGNPDEFSATYTGKLYALTGGTYTFYLGSDDAASVWFDQDTQPTVVNVGDAHGYREATATKKLSAGFHTIRVFYGEHGGSQGLVLRYDGPDMIQQVVPNGVLYTNRNGNPSPVLTEFELNSVGQQVQLHWTTATEHHSKSFVVERSSDGVTFEEIGSLAGAGTSTQAHTYDLIDQRAPLGTTYYRLRQLCGTQAVYSPIKAVEVKEVPLQVSLYPVPNNGTFYLRVQPALPQTATLELWDASGVRAYSAPLPITGQPDVQVSPNVPIGLYTLRLQMANKTIVRRIVIGH